jgi:alginate O-acetyltransferase complex protein AlgI
MRFNSLEFAFFLPVVLAGWALLRGRARHLFLLLASYVFYASWNPPFVLLLWYSTYLDYVCAARIARATSVAARRALLGLSLVGNLGVLFYFKYGNFFVDNVAFVSGIDPEPFYLNVVIPLGISFYTFQTMSYTIDVYRGAAEPCDNFLDFALYVTFFPQLVAGPILRASQFLPQLKRTEPVREDEVIRGVELFLSGLFKKMVVADNFAILADRVFADPGAFSGPAVWMGAMAFALQIYCDFSGYSEMAQGLGHFFGFTLPRNFDYPMLRTNPLTQRLAWHRTMGSWFADYVFRPLGGWASGDLRFALNMMTMWTLIGLWHGAAWHFILWGFNSGLLLTVYMIVMRRKKWSLPEFAGKHFLGWLLNYVYWIAAIMFFRAQTLEDVRLLFTQLLTWAPGTGVESWWVLFLLVFGAGHLASFLWNYNGDLLLRLGWPARIACVTVTVLAIILFGASGRSFIYFQF